MNELVFRPQPGPQETFLASSADIAIYGGAAGGGKTWALLIDTLRYIDVPRFGAVIFRRTYPQITNEGGLWAESERIYPHFGARPRISTLDWRFPSGVQLSMRHLQYEQNKYDYQGAQIAGLLFDELTHFTESQFFYMLSRNRSTCGIKPYVRGTTNPDATSWVKRFLAPWVDKTFPTPAKPGELRWFIRLDGKIQWVPRGTPDAKSVTFIAASVYDNKILLDIDPGYVANLKALPEVDRARLHDGDWDVKREGLVYPAFASCIVDVVPDGLSGTHFGGIDFGFNAPFAALAGTLDHDDVLWVTWERYERMATLPSHAAALPVSGRRWFADPARPDSIAELRIGGHDVVPCLHLGAKPILTGIDRVTERIKTGRLKVSRACVNLIRESESYSYNPDKLKEEPIDENNHAADGLRYMITGIDRGRALPVRVEEPVIIDDEMEALALAERHRKHMSPENPAWWGDGDDE